MSKEREDFEKYAINTLGMDFPGTINGEYLNDNWQEMWLLYQSASAEATAHYQPLLEAKDAEIAELQKQYEGQLDVSRAGWAEADKLGGLRDENTTLKALLEQARSDAAEAKLLVESIVISTSLTAFGRDNGVAYKARAVALLGKISEPANAATGEK